MSEAEQRLERDRLHGIMARLSAWESIGDSAIIEEAQNEIYKSCNGSPPAILDPFAGGGTIPLEAQRLGLEAHASDLNPVAVLINSALIDIPNRFADQESTHPTSHIVTDLGARALAEDVRHYGRLIGERVISELAPLYPRTTLASGESIAPIAWIWARTVRCPNPACGIMTPLTRTWWLGRKKGKETYIRPEVKASDSGIPEIHYTIALGTTDAPGPEGSVGRRGATCVACSTSISLGEIRRAGRAGELGERLMSTVVAHGRQRIYLPPTPEHESAAKNVPHAEPPAGELGNYPRDLKAPTYGLTSFGSLFTPRQLWCLSRISEFIQETHAQVLTERLNRGHNRGAPLHEGGTGALAYADAVTTYLAMALSRTLNKSTSLNTWDSSPKMEAVRGLFARQAIPMAWDYVEANLSGGSSGDYVEDVAWVARALEKLPAHVKHSATISQADAATRSYERLVVSTDPPYYDNIDYSDLSDFFYVWLRKTLRHIHPDIFSTLLVPKVDELVANPYRHGSAEAAKNFFEQGFNQVFKSARQFAEGEFPITVYYAFKQTETEGGENSSTGWETLLDGMISAGWTITATWPVRSELSNRMIASGKNALASSIVLALRPRPDDAPTTDRRGFIRALQAELPAALRKLQQGAIAPVDLWQSAIGPGMAVFSRYAGVIEPDGTKMPVRAALARINEILDEVINEQEGDFDATSRFALSWYRQHGYQPGPFGDADSLARARNTSVDAMDRDEILTSRAGKVQLLAPAALKADYDVLSDEHTSNWEALHYTLRALESGGIDAAGRFLAAATSRADEVVDPDRIKELAHLLFRIAEDSKWTKVALSFNTLVTAWPDILEVARITPVTSATDQGMLDFTQEEN